MALLRDTILLSSLKPGTRSLIKSPELHPSFGDIDATSCIQSFIHRYVQRMLESDFHKQKLAASIIVGFVPGITWSYPVQNGSVIYALIANTTVERYQWRRAERRGRLTDDSAGEGQQPSEGRRQSGYSKRGERYVRSPPSCRYGGFQNLRGPSPTIYRYVIRRMQRHTIRGKIA